MAPGIKYEKGKKIDGDIKTTSTTTLIVEVVQSDDWGGIENSIVDALGDKLADGEIVSFEVYEAAVIG